MTQKFDKELAVKLKSYYENRRNPKDMSVFVGKTLTGTIRVDIKHVEHLNFQAISKEGKEHVYELDEPPQRHGYDRGAGPLHYFLIGAGGCLLFQWAKLAAIENLSIEDLGAIVRGHLDRRIDGGFSDFVFDISLKGSESDDKIRWVASESERFCFAHNTLKRAVPCITNVSYNGRKIYENTVGPG